MEMQNKLELVELPVKKLMFEKIIKGEIDFDDFLIMSDDIKYMEDMLDVIRAKHNRIKDDEIEIEHYLNKLLWRGMDIVFGFNVEKSSKGEFRCNLKFYSLDFEWDLVIEYRVTEEYMTHGVRLSGQNIRKFDEPKIDFGATFYLISED